MDSSARALVVKQGEEMAAVDSQWVHDEEDERRVCNCLCEMGSAMGRMGYISVYPRPFVSKVYEKLCRAMRAYYRIRCIMRTRSTAINACRSGFSALSDRWAAPRAIVFFQQEAIHNRPTFSHCCISYSMII